MFYILAMNIPHLTETEKFFRLLQCHKLHYFVTWPFWVFARGNDRFPYPFIYLKPRKGTSFEWSLPVEAKRRSTPPPSLFNKYPNIGFRVDSDDILGEHYINISKLLNKRGLACSTFHFFSFTTCSSLTESFDEQKQQLAVIACLNVLKISLRVSWNSVCLNA